MSEHVDLTSAAMIEGITIRKSVVFHPEILNPHSCVTTYSHFGAVPSASLGLQSRRN
jgi:hypothetical protein